MARGSLIIRELIKKYGIRVTPKQCLIIEKICLDPNFEDAKRIWTAVQKERKLSTATVYNTISMLVRYGFIRKEKHKMGYKYYLTIPKPQTGTGVPPV